MQNLIGFENAWTTTLSALWAIPLLSIVVPTPIL